LELERETCPSIHRIRAVEFELVSCSDDGGRARVLVRVGAPLAGWAPVTPLPPCSLPREECPAPSEWCRAAGKERQSRIPLGFLGAGIQARDRAASMRASCWARPIPDHAWGCQNPMRKHTTTTATTISWMGGIPLTAAKVPFRGPSVPRPISSDDEKQGQKRSQPPPTFQTMRKRGHNHPRLEKTSRPQ